MDRELLAVKVGVKRSPVGVDRPTRECHVASATRAAGSCSRHVGAAKNPNKQGKIAKNGMFSCKQGLGCKLGSNFTKFDTLAPKSMLKVVEVLVFGKRSKREEI